MADNVDWGQAESSLKQKAGQYYDPTMLDDLKRNSSYGAGEGSSNVDDWIGRISNKAQLRGSNESNSTYQANGNGGVTVGPTGKVNDPMHTQGNGSGGGGGAGGGGWGGGMGAGWEQKANDLYGTLMQRATQSLNINPNDPIVKGQVNSFKAGATRDSRNYVDQMAESGGPSANLTGEKRMAAEHVSQGAGSLQSTLIQNELTQHRNEIQNALTQMGGMLSDQQRIALQQQLGLLDVNLRQQQINSGNDQWSAEFGRGVSNDANHWDTVRRNGGVG